MSRGIRPFWRSSVMGCRFRRWPPRSGCRGRLCMRGWLGMRLRAWKGSRTVPIVPSGVRIRCRPTSSGGIGVAPFAAVLGSAAAGVRVGQAQGCPGAVGVGGVPGSGAGGDDRTGHPGSAFAEVEALERGAPMELWPMDVVQAHSHSHFNVFTSAV